MPTDLASRPISYITTTSIDNIGSVPCRSMPLPPCVCIGVYPRSRDGLGPESSTRSRLPTPCTPADAMQMLRHLELRRMHPAPWGAAPNASHPRQSTAWNPGKLEHGTVHSPSPFLGSSRQAGRSFRLLSSVHVMISALRPYPLVTACHYPQISLGRLLETHTFAVTVYYQQVVKARVSTGFSPRVRRFVLRFLPRNRRALAGQSRWLPDAA